VPGGGRADVELCRARALAMAIRSVTVRAGNAVLANQHDRGWWRSGPMGVKSPARGH